MDYLIGYRFRYHCDKRPVLFDQSGIQIATSSQSYPLYRDAQGMARRRFRGDICSDGKCC